MFEIKKDIVIYKSAIHEEWQNAIAKLTSEGDFYLVKHRVVLLKGSDVRLSLAPIIPGILSKAASDTAVLRTKRMYYASDILKIMIDNPELSGGTLEQETIITLKISKWDVSHRMQTLLPVTRMTNILRDIHSSAMSRGFRSAAMARQRTVCLAYALFGLEFRSGESNKFIRKTMKNVLIGDFGIREVSHATSLFWIVNAIHESRPHLADTVNAIDYLLATHGRPIVRPVPTSSFLRSICQDVKSSPLYRPEKITIIA